MSKFKLLGFFLSLSLLLSHTVSGQVTYLVNDAFNDTDRIGGTDGSSTSSSSPTINTATSTNTQWVVSRVNQMVASSSGMLWTQDTSGSVMALGYFPDVTVAAGVPVTLTLNFTTGNSGTTPNNVRIALVNGTPSGFRTTDGVSTGSDATNVDDVGYGIFSASSNVGGGNTVDLVLRTYKRIVTTSQAILSTSSDWGGTLVSGNNTGPLAASSGSTGYLEPNTSYSLQVVLSYDGTDLTITTSLTGGNFVGLSYVATDSSGSPTLTFNELGIRCGSGSGEFDKYNITSLTVTTPQSSGTVPSISTQPSPASQTVNAGSNVTYSVTASGSPSPSYQWKLGSTDLTDSSGHISGATTSSLTLTNVQAADAGSYAVVVSNTGGSTTSDAVTLAVTSPPSAPTATAATGTSSSGFTANWDSVTDATGYRLDVATDNAFSSYVTGYQDLDVGTNVSQAVAGLSASTSYYYRVRAVNGAGTSASSNTVTATTGAAAVAPSITTQPTASQTVNVGDNASFSVVASGTATLTYQWKKDGTDLTDASGHISGSTTDTLSLTSVLATDAGTYTVVVTNTGGSDTSTDAVLTVLSAPSAPTATAATGATTSGFAANWGSVSGATGYRVDVATDSSFTSYVTGYQDLDAGDVVTLNVTGLSADTSYYYRVRAYNTVGTSASSNTITAMTASAVTNNSLLWSAYDTTGAIVGTQNQAGTFDAGTGAYTFTVPAGQQYTFVTTNFVPVVMTTPGSGTTIQTVSYQLNSTSGWTGAITGNRINQVGLFDYGSTPPDGTAGNFSDDNGLWGDLKGGTWGNEVFGGVPTAAGLIVGYQSTVKLGSGKSAGTNTSWTLVDNTPVVITVRIALNSSGTFSLGTSSSYANAGIVIEDAAHVGDGTSFQAIYSGGASAVTAPHTFNEFAFYFRNDSATDSTLTLSNLTGLTAPPYFAAINGEPPATLTGSIGDNLSISVNALGSAIAYQWQKSTDGGTTFDNLDTTANPTAATATLTLSTVQNADAGQYRVIISNDAGSNTSTVCTVSVTSGAVAPSVQTDPQAATILVGGSNTFSVSASGTAPLTYQWQVSTDSGSNWTDISGATSSTYTLANAQLSDTALYRVVVTNGAGTANSASAALTVNQVPAFTTQPTGGTLHAGDALTLTAAATGTPTPTYQWQLNGVALTGATSASYAITNATGAATGNYTVVATNAAGTTTSATATVNVLAAALDVSSAAPAPGATGVFPDQPLTLTFNQAIAAGLSGTIKIYDSASPGTPVDTIDFTSATARTASTSKMALPVQTQSIGGQAGFNYYPVTISGSTLTIYPRNGTLTYGKTYYVTMDPGVIVDATGATFAGASDSTTWSFTTKASGPSSDATTLTVAADGSGDFRTVQGALDFIPAANTTPITIDIKNGTYWELVSWTNKSNLTFVGESRDGVIIGYPNNNTFNPGGTAWRAAFTCRGGGSTGLTFTNLTIRNFTAKTGSQAEALYLSGSATAMAAVLTHVSLYSYQDTLLINGQAYIADSYIEGDTDFMWGNGPVYFTNCELKALSIQSYYTQIRNPSTNHGFVYVNCTFDAAAADSQNPSSPVSGCYLGRLDQNANPHTEVVLINGLLGDHILPVAWNLNGQTTTAAATTNCAEYNSRDLTGTNLIDVSQRATWSYQWTSPTNDTEIAHYSDPVWVLNTDLSGTSNGSWTPALKPIVTTQPADTTITAGTQLSLTVAASAIPAATYQWNKDGTPITGATSATYTVPTAATADSGTYTVDVSNSAGTTSSNPASVTVASAPSAPTATAATAATTSGFTASWGSVSGATGYRLDVSTDSGFGSYVTGYQDLDAGTATSTAVTGLSAGTTYYYRVRAVNDVGTSASSNTITIVTTSASTGSIGISNSGSTADGNYSLGDVAYTQNFDSLPSSGTFTWVNGVTLAGWYAAPATGSLNTTGVVSDGSSNLADQTLASVGMSAASDRALAYHTRLSTNPTYLGLEFTNNSGRELNGFSLTYTPEQWRENTNQRNLTFTVQYKVGASPSDLNVASGWTTIDSLAFTSNNGSVGATATLTASAVAVTVPDGSTIWFRWITANDATSSTSSNDIIALDNVSVSFTAAANGSPTITTQPASQTVTKDDAVSFTVVATGDPTLTYQWSKDGTAITGATSATYSIASAQASDDGSYTVVVTNGKGSATSTAATLTVNVPSAPSITTQPQTQTVTVGDNVTLSVVATGTAPLTYQWKLDGTAITSATSATLSLTSVQMSDGGSYTVDVTNDLGTATSDAATLTVQAAVPQAPSIATQPTAQTVSVGGTATFTVVASGTAPLTYQWSKGAAAITGATSSTLTLTDVQQSDAANYSVTVTNDLGSATSDSVALTVTTALPVEEFDLTGFATLGSGTTGGGVIPDTDPAYRKCYTAQDFVQAIADANKTAGKVKVIEIMNDLSLGWNEVGTAVQNIASNPLRSHNAPKLHPVLLVTGVSLLDIKAKSPLTIFSANGATIKHVNFNVKGTSNIIIRNLKFDEMWEWDEASKGNYDSNDWDFITLSNGGDATNIWIDHCTFTKSYDGIVDMKAGTQYVTLSWCKYVGDDEATNPNSWVRQQIAVLEAHRSSYAFYNFLRNNGFSEEDIITIIQGHDKTHLMGSNNLDPGNATLSATFHHQWFTNLWDRCVPRLRAGNVHVYDVYADDTNVLAAKRLRDQKANVLSSSLRSTLNNTYSFNPPINGCISTEGGAVLLEKSMYVDCLWPLRNNQTNPSNPVYTGKIKALDTIYVFHNTDNTVTTVRGDSTDAGNPMGPFQATVIPFSWNLPNNQLPYSYTTDDPAQLPAILAAGAGAGTLTWSKDNWLRTSYVTDTTTAPSILSQPQAQTVATGVDATFTVQANGAAPLTYQWSKDGTPLTDGGNVSGATTAALTISAATDSDAGSYTVTVTNGNGNVTSSAAALTIIPATAPSITTQPQSQAGPLGGAIELDVVAGGTGPFTYQWSKGGTAIVGATGPSLTLDPLQAGDAGSYTVVVTNSQGSITSDAAVVTIGSVPATPVAAAATNIATTSFTANWAAATDATGYRIDVSTSSAFDGFVGNYHDLDVGANLSAAVTGLTASTTYYYRVWAYNTYGTGMSSDAVPVTTQASSNTGSGTTILSENFPLASATYPVASPAATINDGLSTDSNSLPVPTSARAVWASFGTANIAYVQATSLGVSAGASRGLMAYFEPSTSLASIDVGESLTATVKFSFVSGTLAENPGNFRLALLNSGGNGTANNIGSTARFASGVSNSLTGTPTGNTARGYSGYIVDTEASTSATADTQSFWLRTAATSSSGGSTQIVGPTGASDLGSSSTFSQIGATGGGAAGAIVNDGTVYTATLTVTHTSASQIDLSYTVTNGTTTVKSYSVSQTAGSLVTSFDSFMFFSTFGGAPSISGFSISKSGAAAAVAPAITVQPMGQTVVADTPVTLSVAASGTAPLTYQWKKDGTAISGATSALLAIPSAQDADAGSYTVVVTNTADSVTSDAAALVVNDPPVITTAPQTKSVVAGSDVTFTVVATGTAPLSYQWQHAGIDITGATSSTLSLTNVQLGDAGDYTVVVTNLVTSVTSSAATLTVTSVATVPSITTQPQTQSATLGDNVSLSVVATGTAPLAYQWSKDGTPIGGATSSTLALANVQPADAGSYTVTVTNDTGSVSSDTATLTVTIPAPVIGVQPKSQSALTGTRVSFSVLATGYHLTYQWSKDGTPIAGATDPMFALVGIQAADAASYTVTVTNDGGSVTSSAATLTLVTPAATLPTQPTIPAAVFKVTDYGAVGDGTTDSTAGIAAAITAALNAGGGTIELPPATGAYLSGPLTLRSNMNLQIDGGATLRMLPYGTYPNANLALIAIPSGSTNVAITGAGTIEGDGSAWWAAYNGNSNTARPRIIQSSRATNMLISGLTLQNAPMFHVSFSSSATNVTIYGLTITAPSTSPNTDGIDPAGTNFLIQGCSVSTGDDNVAVKADSPCSNITIADCAFGTGHGLSVGGQTNSGLNGMNVMRCTFNGTSVGLRLKADATQGGPVQNLTYSDLTMTNVPSPIVFYSYYNIVGSPGAVSGSSQTTPAKVLANNATPPNSLASSTLPSWKNITIRNLTATGATAYSILWGLPLADGLIANVTLDNVSISGGSGLEVYDATNVQFVNGTSVGNVTTANALAITGQPQTQTVAASGSASFSVTAVGTSGVNSTAPTYQWKLNGTALTDGAQTGGSMVSGATTASLTVSNLGGADAGDYTCVVSNNLDGYDVSGSTLAAGSLPVSATSSAGTLTVSGAAPVAPSIVTQPVSQTVDSGSAVTFEVSAFSAVPVTYQWKHGGVDLPNETGASLVLQSVQAADAGDYTVVVTNSAGSTTSAVATLTVNVLDPTVSVILHDNFAATAQDGDLSFDANNYLVPTATQAVWYGGGAIPTYASGTSIGLSAGNRGLLAYFAPSASLASLDVGESLTANAKFSYAGGTGASLAGDLRIGLLGSGGGQQNVLGAPSRIAGDNFSLTAGGDTPRGYSGYFVDTTAAATTSTDTLSFWRRDGGLPPTGGSARSQQWLGPTSSDVTANTTFSQLGQAGGGSVGAVTNNGTVYAARLIVKRVSATDTQLTYTLTADDGATTVMSYSTTETSETPLTTFDSFFILSTYNAALTVTDFSVLKTAAVPTITTAPSAQDVAAGADATFMVAATGTAPLTYQWSKGGTALTNGGRIAGADTATLTITGADGTDSGDYTVTVSNAYGSATSDPATLTVAAAPTISTQPQSQTAEIGAAVTLSVTADGTPAPTYQWQKDGQPIADATSATYTIASAQATDAGSYTVVVTNSSGSVTSSAATLTVKVHNFAGIYFGQFGTGGNWALVIHDDNTGTFIAYLPNRQSAIVLTLTVNPDGTFNVNGSEITPTMAGRQPLALDGGAGTKRTPQAASFTLQGQITGNGIAGQLSGLSETFEGAADATSGSSSSIAGFYTAAAIGSTSGTTYTVIGASGQTVVVTTGASLVTGGSGTVNAQGQLSITTADSTQITIAVNSSNQNLSAEVLPSGSSTPITFVGLPDTVTPTTRIVNLSVRGDAGSSDNTLIMGFVINGAGSQSVLVRGIGPGLVPQGVPVETVLADPQLRLFNNATHVQIDQNDDWGGTDALRNEFTALGAFALPDNSKDAALATALPAGLYSAHVTTTGTVSGVSMIEVYDATLAGEPHFANVSVRAVSGNGDHVLIAGFVLSGNAPKQLLIRAVGPTLVNQGLSASSVLADPKLVLYHGSTVIGQNDDWGGTTTLKSAFQTTGAFDLSSDTSKDAALLVTLQPGIYTVHAPGVNNTTGVALLEIYEVP